MSIIKSTENSHIKGIKELRELFNYKNSYLVNIKIMFYSLKKPKCCQNMKI